MGPISRVDAYYPAMIKNFSSALNLVRELVICLHGLFHSLRVEAVCYKNDKGRCLSNDTDRGSFSAREWKTKRRKAKKEAFVLFFRKGENLACCNLLGGRIGFGSSRILRQRGESALKPANAYIERELTFHEETIISDGTRGNFALGTGLSWNLKSCGDPFGSLPESVVPIV